MENSFKGYGNDSLCFDKSDFMKKNFNVDTFVQIHQASGSGGLEILRDDLGIYLKILRSAMIDLINRDYADFVNLSTNLTGLDNVIDSLKTPLGQLREEVLSVERLISSAMESISHDLKRRHTINQQKSLLHRINQISIRLERLESLLKSRDDNENSTVESGNDLIDRLASEVNHLNFLVAQCEGAVLLKNFKPRVEAVCNFVEVGLERGLREGIQERNNQLLLRVLRTYGCLDTIDHAHQQVRTLMRSHLEEVISDFALRSDPRGLRGMYEKCLAIVKKICSPLLEVSLGHGPDIVIGFSFLEESVWPEIVFALETRTPHIFNPGNPSSFHERYEESLRFLDRFEDMLQYNERIVAFRESPNYHKFWDQWNLPVYFQIRYQEIGQVMESSISNLSGGLDACTVKESKFKLNSTYTTWESLLKCFNQEIFILSLLHRFWKLSLLILSRYRMWVSLKTENIKMEASNKKGRISSPHNITEQLDKGGPFSGVTAAVFILHDNRVLISNLQTYFQDYIETQIVDLPLEKKNIIKDLISQEMDKLNDLKSSLLNSIVVNLIDATSHTLKQVTDTPRIYRRTNKSVPSTNQQYIANAIQSIANFNHMAKDLIENDDMIQINSDVFTNLTLQYYNLVNEVLSSVQKMEESLRRLKQARDRGQQQGAEQTGGHTDDDKIRIQIYLDVLYLGEKITELGIDKSTIQQYQPLLTITENAKDGKFVS